MAAIKHTELFDFPAYEAAIKEVKASTADFGNTAEGIIKRLQAQQKQLTDELKGYAATLKNFNVVIGSAKSTLDAYNTTVDATTANMNELNAVEKAMVQTVNAQKTAVDGLDRQYRELLDSLKQLNPASATYAKESKAIKDQINSTLSGIKAYNQGVKESTRTVKAAEGSYKAMQTELTALRNRLKSLPGAFDELTGKINRNNKEVVALDARIKQLDGTLKRADNQMGIFTRNVGNYSSAFKGLGGALASTLGVASAFELGKAIFDINRQSEGLNNALRLVSGSSAELAINQAFLTKIAKDYGLEILTLTDSFKNFFVASTKAGIDADNSRRIFDSVSKAAANLKLSTEQVNGVFTAFGQIASKGTVQAEELRGQIGERIPGAFSIAAKSIGVTQAELNKLLEQGLLPASDFLPKFAAGLEEAFGKEDKIESLNASINRFFNALRTGVESENLTKFLTKVIDLAAQAVEGLFSILDAVTDIDNINIAFGVDEDRAKAIANKAIKEIKKINEQAAKERAERIASIDKDFRSKEQSEQIKTVKSTIATVERLQRELRAATTVERKKALTSELKFESDVLGTLSKSYDDLNNKKISPFKKKTDGGKTGPSAEELLAKRIKTEQDLLKRAAELEIANQELLLSEKLINEAEFQAEKLGIINDFVNASIELENKKGKNADAGVIDSLKKQAIAAQIELNKFNDAAQKEQESKAAKAIGEGLNKQKEYNKKVGEGIRELNDKRFQGEIDAENKAYALAEQGRDTTFKEEEAHLKRLQAIKKKYAKDTGEEELAISSLYAERRREIDRLKEQVTFDAINAGLTIVQEQYNAKSEERLAKLEEEKERELALVGNNAAARAVIEERYNKEVAKQKRKQAQADKVFSLFNVAISTAEGVVKTIAQFGMPAALPLIPLVIAGGAIQAAVIAARPIPQFKKGTKSAPSGLAIVGEEGPELIERNGKMMITPGRASFVKLTGGEKIHTAKETERILERAEKTETINRVMAGDASTMAAIMRAQVDADARSARNIREAMRINSETLEAAFRRSVRDIPVNITTFDERGAISRKEAQNSRTTYLNSKTLGG